MRLTSRVLEEAPFVPAEEGEWVLVCAECGCVAEGGRMLVTDGPMTRYDADDEEMLPVACSGDPTSKNHPWVWGTI